MGTYFPQKGLRYTNGFGKSFFADLADIGIDVWHMVTGKVDIKYTNAYDGDGPIADVKDIWATFAHMFWHNLVLFLALAVIAVWLPLVIRQGVSISFPQNPAPAAPISVPVIVPSQPETLAPTAVPTSTPTVAPTVTPTPTFVLPPIDPNLIDVHDEIFQKDHLYVCRFDNEYGDKYWVTEKDLLEKYIPALGLDPSMTWGYNGGGFTGDFGCWAVLPWPRINGHDVGFGITGLSVYTVEFNKTYYNNVSNAVRPIPPEYITGEFKTQIPDLGAPEQ